MIWLDRSRRARRSVSDDPFIHGGSKRRGRIASNLREASRLTVARELLSDHGGVFYISGRTFSRAPVTFIPWNNGKPRDVL